MRRCVACGRFFDGDECPSDHSHIEEYTPAAPLPPPPYEDIRGKLVTITWPSTGILTNCVVCDLPDDDGEVGLMVLAPNIRVALHDIQSET